MSAHEVAFLIGADDVVLWADLDGQASRLPDSRSRWEAIWSRRDELVEIAHTHPHGPLAFSHEDETTMDALDAALGRSLAFSIVTPDGYLRRADGEAKRVTDEPWWTTLLRSVSGLGQPTLQE